MSCITITPKTDSEYKGTPILLGYSTLTAQKLVEDGVVEDLKATPEPTEMAVGLAIRALMENRLYFYQMGLLTTLVHSVLLRSTLAALHLSLRY